MKYESVCKRFHFAFLGSFLAISFWLVARAEDWPKGGGIDPGGNRFSAEIGLPESFDPGKLKPGTDEVDPATTRNVKWVVKLGSQTYGGLVVAGGKVFIGTNNETPRDPNHQGDRGILMCFDEQTGRFHWQLAVPKLPGRVNDWEHVGLLTTPAVESNRVYLVTNRGEVLCLTTEGYAKGNHGPFQNEGQYFAGHGKSRIEPGPTDADIVWRYDMMQELGVFPHQVSCSAVLPMGDLLYVGTGNGRDWALRNVPSQLSPSLIALNKHTGKLVGKDNARIGTNIFRSTWSSPSTGKINGNWQIYFGGGDGVCYAFDSKPRKGTRAAAENPDDDYLKKVWWADCNPAEYKVNNKGRPLKYPAPEGPSEIMATPVFWKNRVYVAIGQYPENGEGLGHLVCLDATLTGDITQTGVLWSNKTIRRTMSAVSITPEGLLFATDFSGSLYCFDAECGELYWVHNMSARIGCGAPLVVDGKVYLGDEDGDFCIFTAGLEKRLLHEVNLGYPIYTGPIVANGVLFVATTTHLFAIHDAAAKSPAASGAAVPAVRVQAR